MIINSIIVFTAVYCIQISGRWCYKQCERILSGWGSRWTGTTGAEAGKISSVIVVSDNLPNECHTNVISHI